MADTDVIFERVPLIDRAVPTRMERATFALG